MNPYNQPYNQHHIPPQQEFGVITPTLKKVFLGIIIFTWLIALPLKAYDGPIDLEGYLCLGLGWASIIANGFAFLAWLANLPFAIALFMFVLSQKKTTAKIAFILSAIAFVLSLNAIWVFELPVSAHSSSGSVSVSFGAFVWIFSFAMLTLISFLNMKFFREPVKKQPLPPVNYQQQYQHYYQQPYYPPQQQNYPPPNPPQEPTRKGMGDNF